MKTFFKKQHNHRTIALVCLLALGIVGCTNDSDSTDSGEDSVIDNCGYQLELHPTPERVVTVKSTTLEMMLALGLEDHIVGSAALDGPVPENLTPTHWEPNMISDDIPTREALLATEPDLVFAGWESNLSADGIGTRESLDNLGIRSYVSPPACAFGDENSEAATFDDVFSMINELGIIFDREDAASSLIAKQQERLDSIEPLDHELTALWYSSGGDTPFVAGGTGTPSMIMSAAGLTNVTNDEPNSWFNLPWELFIASDPDVIVLVDAPWNSAEEKIERLESHPAARKMRAVQNENYFVVDFATTEAGVRNIEAVESLAEASHALEPTP